jgi:DNA repair and recombination protein RAD54B
MMFEALNTTRRVILSGTPIQNDLGEFHAMVSETTPNFDRDYRLISQVDFCNPGLLSEDSRVRLTI